MTRFFPLLAICACFLISCSYPIPKRTTAQTISGAKPVETPVKIHLTGGSVMLCLKGFVMIRDTILATGRESGPDREVEIPRSRRIPLSDVVGIEYYDEDVQGARALSSVLLGATVTAEVGFATIVLLKAIFGSCPTMYTLTNGKETLEAEGFSYSIGSWFEMSDLDRLSTSNVSGSFTLRVKNEALETHYIDALKLSYVDHPFGSQVFPTSEGSYILTTHLVPPDAAVHRDGCNVLRELTSIDGQCHELDASTMLQLFESRQKEWIECRVANPLHSDEVTVVLRARNSLENTVLLYDVMMRNQGLSVLAWTASLNKNWWYAWRLSRWYKEFAGMEVLVKEGETYESRGKIFDTGPLAWKDVAIRIPVDAKNDHIVLRLQTLPDNWKIDRVAFDFTPAIDVTPHDVPVTSAVGTVPQSSKAVEKLLADDDHSYFVTYPGESVDLGFILPPLQQVRTIFVKSRGYYVEWIRPEWLQDRPDVTEFDFRRDDTVRASLVRLWLNKKRTFEEDFFRYRVPVAMKEKE
jgi:hypothetical protein